MKTVFRWGFLLIGLYQVVRGLLGFVIFARFAAADPTYDVAYFAGKATFHIALGILLLWAFRRWRYLQEPPGS